MIKGPGSSPTADFDIVLGPGEATTVRIRDFDAGACSGGGCSDVVVGSACGPVEAVDLALDGDPCIDISPGGGAVQTFDTGPGPGIFSFCAPQ